MPSTNIADRLVEMTDFGEKQDIVVKMWTRVKALPLGLEVKIFSVCLLIAIIAIIAYSIYKKVEKKKLVAGKIEQLDNGTQTPTNNTFKTYSLKAKEYVVKIKYKLFNNKHNDKQTDSENNDKTE